MSILRTLTGTLAAIVIAGASAQAAGNLPPIGGDYAAGAKVVPIPIDDPAVKAISGALFKPAGTGPFPVVVYMPSQYGLESVGEMAFEKNMIEHLTSKGFATLIVDPFTARSEPSGIVNNLSPDT
jgi:hypothetical protein